MSDIDALYQDVLLEHHQDPRNFGELPHYDIRKEGFNPLCGDRVVIDLEGEHSNIKNISFTGEGCSICMASASILMEQVENKSFAEVSDEIENFRKLLQDQKDPSTFESDVRALSGVKRFPVRIKCALLPWMTLKEAIQELKAKKP